MIKLHDYQVEAIFKLEEFFKTNPEGRGYLHIATGGGKTLVANTFILNNYLSKNKKVLWLAPDWLLLAQAYSSIVKLCEETNFDDLFPSYIGNYRDNKIDKILQVQHEELEGLEIFEIENGEMDPEVVNLMYTTPHTFNFREPSKVTMPDLLVIDEAHWGKGGKLEKEILKFAEKNSIPILGLSATPKHRNWRAIFSKTFKELIGTYLASPVFNSIDTGLKVDITKSTKDKLINMIPNETYKELGSDKKRNELIVSTYKFDIHGKTIVFAIDKDHANKLGRLFQKKGHDVIIVHGGVSNHKENIEKFKKNEDNVRIIIAVNMLNQGVDIPDVNTLFITRPVTSDILYSQMIGRGARLCKEKNKTTFNVIDFEDNFLDEKIQKSLFELKKEFFGSGGAKETIYNHHYSHDKKYEPKLKYPSKLLAYEPSEWGQYLFEKENLSVSIPFLKNQTFGVEIELTTMDFEQYCKDESLWNEVASKLYGVMNKSLPSEFVGICGKWQENDQALDYSKFNLVYDGSCGWEIVSSVLKGSFGFSLLFNFLEELNRGIKEILPYLVVNHRTGFHVHLAFDLNDSNVAPVFDGLFAAEPLLGCLVPPSRFNEYDESNNSYDSSSINEFCEPLRVYFDHDVLGEIKSLRVLEACLYDDDEINRYLTFNFENILRGELNTLEVRMHSGTTDSLKVLSWISCCMGLLDQSRKNRNLSNTIDKDLEMPDKELFENFKRHMITLLPDSYLELIEKVLEPRSKEVLKQWIDAKVFE